MKFFKVSVDLLYVTRMYTVIKAQGKDFQKKNRRRRFTGAEAAWLSPEGAVVSWRPLLCPGYPNRFL